MHPSVLPAPARLRERSVAVVVQEEIAKRSARADRFQVAANTVLQYLPDEEDEIRRRRAERFAVTVTPTGAEGLNIKRLKMRVQMSAMIACVSQRLLPWIADPVRRFQV